MILLYGSSCEWQSHQVVCTLPQGLDHVMFVAATGNRLLLRQYAIAFKKSGALVPRTELAEIGPRIDFSIRRSRGAPGEIQTQSMKQPKLEKKKVCHNCSASVTLPPSRA